jgi:hypothetical protein
MDADPGPASASTALGSRSGLDAVISPFYRKVMAIKRMLFGGYGLIDDILPQ